MPLLNGRAVKLIPFPRDVSPTDKVFQIRFTGEVFKSYEEYSARLDFYRQPKFSCKYTGKSGFNYENAIDHENQTKQTIFNQIPQQYLPIIFKETQYSQLKLSDLVNKIYEKCINKFKIDNNITDEPPKLEQIPNQTNNENNNNSNNSNPEKKGNEQKEKEKEKEKKPKKKSFKHPFKKNVIRAQIRVAANQQNFKNAPWILNDEIATKYDITQEIPQPLKLLIDQYLKNKNKPKKATKREKKEKTQRKKKEKKEKKEPSKSIKPESLIAALTIKPTPKSIKYPCDDQLLLMYEKMDNEKLIAFDTFWSKIDKIGLNDNQQNNNDDESSNNYSNLAFFDYNSIYDGNGDQDVDMIDDERNKLKHRQLNNLFNEIWKLWSFIQVFHENLDITPFPISFLMDSLCYDKRCILLDELQCCLLEIIRKHVITTIQQRFEQKKQDELKKIKARKKQQKANKKKQERKKQRQAAKSDKEEADDNDDEEEESEESELETDSEESEESSDEETESEDDEDEDIDLIDADQPPLWDENSIFTDEPITFFKLDLLREYLRFRCSPQIQKEEQKVDGEESMDIDEKDEVQEEVDIDMKTEDSLENEEEEEEIEPLLPEYEYSLSEEIWDKLNNIRSYVTLPIESKLDILKILFQDVMSTNVMIELTQEKIDQYPTIKQEIKLLDDEYSALVKEEKHKLRQQRNELINKKRVLNPKKSKSKTLTKPNGDRAGSSSSSASSSSSTATTAQSVSGSNSPSSSPNKENNGSLNGSKANSRSSSQGLTERTERNTTNLSRREAMMRKKEEKERELKEREEERLREKEWKQKQALKREVERMNDEFKNAQNLMNERLRMKELEVTYKKYDLGLKYKTYLTELGEDRFYNKYFWNNYSDGRIFVYHSNLIYHQFNKNNNKNNNDNMPEIKDCLITKEIMKMNQNEMKCYNEWDLIKEEGERNEFCWSFISHTTQFYQLLSILDERGARENELLLMLNTLKKDIVSSMRMMGNDDYLDNMNMMNIDERSEMMSDKSSTTTEDAPLRRSKRTTRSTRSTRNKSIYITNAIPPYKQFANKGFLAYKNMTKRK